jgi:hypothetical protein
MAATTASQVLGAGVTAMRARGVDDRRVLRAVVLCRDADTLAGGVGPARARPGRLGGAALDAGPDAAVCDEAESQAASDGGVGDRAP